MKIDLNIHPLDWNFIPSVRQNSANPTLYFSRTYTFLMFTLTIYKRKKR